MKNERDGKTGKPDREEKMNSQERSAPGWADGLRQLYDSVVDEPLPDNFKDLLSKLDDKS